MLKSYAFASNTGVLIFVGVVVLSLQLHFDVVESVSKAKSCEAEQFRTRQNRDDDRGKRPAKSSPTLANSDRAAVEDPRPRDKQKQMEDRQLQQLPNASATGAAQRGKVKCECTIYSPNYRTYFLFVGNYICRKLTILFDFEPKQRGVHSTIV